MVPETPPPPYPGAASVLPSFPLIAHHHNDVDVTEETPSCSRPFAPVEPPAETFLSKLKRLMFGDPDTRRKRCKPKTKSYQFGCCFFVVLIIFTISTVGCLIMWFTDMYLDSILNQMILKEDSEVYRAWKDPPVKPLICVHIFNYTNIDEYFADPTNTKIKIKDTGPYCYRETLKKVDVKFYGNGTVSYGDNRTHVFEARNSTGSKSDTLVVPNFLFLGGEAITRDDMWSDLGLRLLRDYRGEKPMIRFTADELIFGFETIPQLIMDAAHFLNNEIPTDKIGILAMRAAVTKERLTVFTGSGDLNMMGVVEAVNGQRELKAWEDPECNRLDGSDGAFFPRHDINESAVLHLFHKDLCRKLPLVFQKEVDFQDGVMGMRFHVPPDVYNTTGTCYCKNNTCPPAGVFDISPCAYGFPVLMSFPHFLNADPSVTAHLDGLHPDPEKHDFIIDIQPILGFTLGTVARIQVNFQVRKSHINTLFENFTEGTILPVTWFEVTADRLPPDLFKMIYHASVTVQWIQWGLQWGSLAAVLLSGFLLLFLSVPRRQTGDTKYNKPTNTTTTTEIVTCKITSL